MSPVSTDPGLILWAGVRVAAWFGDASLRARSHDLRHEAASRLAEGLPDPIELAAVTGHKDLRMLKRYYHPRAADLVKKLG